MEALKFFAVLLMTHVYQEVAVVTVPEVKGHRLQGLLARSTFSNMLVAVTADRNNIKI